MNEQREKKAKRHLFKCVNVLKTNLQKELLHNLSVPVLLYATNINLASNFLKRIFNLENK